MNLLYKNEKPLFITLLLISSLVWASLVFGTKGLVLAYLVAFVLFYLFAQSAFISYLRGTAVKISPEQFPDLHEKITACCQRLGLATVPEAYLMHAEGAFNALATRFLGRNFIVLFSDIVDALEEHPDALNFYIGHEIGHLKRNHLRWGPFLAPAALLPVVGAAYSRAREYTCDRHGLAACQDAASAQLGLGALAAGAKRWRTIDKERYVAQTRESSGFWMSLHELISDYPWLTKRVAAMQALARGEEPSHPRRNPFAWFFALFVPRMGVGGGAASGLIVIAMIGIMAAIAIPAYSEYNARAGIAQAVSVGRQATTSFTTFYQAKKTVPRTLAQTGFVLPAKGPVQEIKLESDGTIVLTVAVSGQAGKSILFVPSLDEKKRIVWACGSRDISRNLLPKDCQD